MCVQCALLLLASAALLKCCAAPAAHHTPSPPSSPRPPLRSSNHLLDMKKQLDDILQGMTKVGAREGRVCVDEGGIFGT